MTMAAEASAQGPEPPEASATHACFQWLHSSEWCADGFALRRLGRYCTHTSWWTGCLSAIQRLLSLFLSQEAVVYTYT